MNQIKTEIWMKLYGDILSLYARISKFDPELSQLIDEEILSLTANFGLTNEKQNI